MKLTAKQRLFADEYIKSGNATQSAIKAGYSDNYAKHRVDKLLLNVGVKSYIDAKMAEIESHKIADAKEVLQFYTRVLREEETEEVALPAGNDVVTVEKKPSFKDRLTAAKELMKRYPLSDPMIQAELRKLNAEADIAEQKAQQLSNNVADDLTINIVRNDRSIEDEEANNN
ncbi:terminase small subunit [Limosilactobacillus reuteri]|uniref:Terminase small subunit n=1 Tax=Limosilactobacillus reuteri TaxID=1598 RepID=A0ABD6Y6X7_LIMRT|nr:terminase small subunit [Limosilactobacillus reuteri]PWT37569.1 terminase small subunit [Limosilactobacillus reuteri]